MTSASGQRARSRALIAGSGDSADALFLEALRYQTEHTQPSERARTALAYGEFLRRAQRRREARVQLKEILTSTATDIGAAADQQGAGLLNTYAAVEAARQMPGTSATSSDSPELVDNPTQLNVQGAGGSTVNTSVTLYNASANAERVSGTYRALGSETNFGSPVTENVSAPSPPFPAQGAPAAAPITFTVPKGADVLDADMRWPDPTNNDNNILSFILTDPNGRLAQSPSDLASTGPENFQFEAHATDATPTPDNPTGNASLITPDPQPGLVAGPGRRRIRSEPEGWPATRSTSRSGRPADRQHQPVEL